MKHLNNAQIQIEYKYTNESSEQAENIWNICWRKSIVVVVRLHTQKIAFI